MRKRIVIAGGSGFLGQVLARHFHTLGYQIVILSRKERQHPDYTYIEWDGKYLGPWTSSLDGAEAVINLSGRSVNCRYNLYNRTEILYSRLESTNVLGRAIVQSANPPKVWMNSSSATIYRHAEDKAMTESTGELGSGFSVDVCKNWEQALFQHDTPNTRKVALRSALVFGRDGSTLPVYNTLAKLGIGGAQGPGTQYVSWIHEEDFARAVTYILGNARLEGPINLAAPSPVQNHIFMRTLRASLNLPFGIRNLTWMTRLGAWLMGTEAELVLKSRRVVGEKLQRAGFSFNFTDIKTALFDLNQPSLERALNTLPRTGGPTTAGETTAARKSTTRKTTTTAKAATAVIST